MESLVSHSSYSVLCNLITKDFTVPQHIYYFRDGVSEGEFAKLINEEVAHLKKAIVSRVGPNGGNVSLLNLRLLYFQLILLQIKFTVIVCTKRHHIRFFPKDGDNNAADKNGNPLPGTLVERDVTHPTDYDFCKSSSVCLPFDLR